MDILRIAAFSEGGSGGNPAGVVIEQKLPETSEMQRIAHEVGYSETAFAAPSEDGYRVRYFSPESEVPFCGHATIALGAALAMQEGNDVFQLSLNEANISVEGRRDGDFIWAALRSPLTKSVPAEPSLVKEALALFGYSHDDLDLRIPPAIAEAGATHLVLALRERSKLAAMDYDLDAGRKLMNGAGLVTINLIYAENDRLFHARNAFASGGVLEDPATGAAAAALAGYLRDLGWAHDNSIEIVQGEDMDAKSRLKAEFSDDPGSSITVSGNARVMSDQG
ncbi:MAG: PhzF family phenazine biosynthesis protein [Rhizobiaceae bacterium]